MNKKASTAVIITLCIFAVFFIILIPQEIAQQYLPIVIAAPIIVIIAAVIFIYLSKKKSVPKSDLQLKRQNLLAELKEAEKQFMQHKIDKSTFDKISQAKNSELVLVEAEIDTEKRKDIPKEDLKRVEKLHAEKKEILLGLLNQKQLKVHELKIAESMLYKRKINESVFQKISSQIKSELITIEAQIKVIYANEEIMELKDVLKQGAKEITKQKKLTQKWKKYDYAEEVERDLLGQIK